MSPKRDYEPRDALRLLEPSPVALVTSQFRSQPNVLTVAWLMPLSFSPTQLAIALHPDRFSHELISRSETFIVNIPTAEQLRAIHLCGLLSGRDHDKFAAASLTPADARELDIPIIEECVGHIECGLIERVRFGDHDLFIGQVLAVTAEETLFHDRWEVVEAEGFPLVHHLGSEAYVSGAKLYRVRVASEEEAEAAT